MYDTFNKYKDIIACSEYKEKKFDLIQNLMIIENEKIRVAYAPFEYINKDAKVVICGITPGLTQAINALNCALILLNDSKKLSDTQILKESKKVASFSGGMRKILINMLDEIGFNTFLNLSTTEELFDKHENLIHYTSLLRNPVFINDKNYSGRSPEILKNKILREELKHFIAEVNILGSNIVYIPLGKSVEKVFNHLISDENILLKEEQVLFGLPHPSPANGWRKRQLTSNKANLIKQIRTFNNQT